MHHGRALVRVKHSTGPHCVQELQEHVRVLGDPKVGPLGVVEVLDLTGIFSLGSEYKGKLGESTRGQLAGLEYKRTMAYNLLVQSSLSIIVLHSVDWC